MSSLRRQEGYSLVEVMIVSVLMIVVLGATLTALSSFQKSVSTNDRQNDAQDQVRNAMGLMARDLRNLASPTTNEPLALDLMETHQVVFQSEGRIMPSPSSNVANTTRVRYCVGLDNKLYRQIQTWTTAVFPAMPATDACPGTWPNSSVVADHVVNGDARPLFLYNAVAPDSVTEVTSQLWVDVNATNKSPAEQMLQTAVYLRNQNRRPVASFSLALANSGNQIIMNASDSTDPEEKALFFTWIIDGVEATGENATRVVHTAVVSPGVHSVKVIVSDGTLSDTAPEQTICVPAPAQGVNC